MFAPDKSKPGDVSDHGRRPAGAGDGASNVAGAGNGAGGGTTGAGHSNTTRHSTNSQTWSDSDISEIKSARNKVGIYPITLKHITHQYQILTSKKSNDTPDVIFNSEQYIESRLNAAYEFLDFKLQLTGIKIHDCKMSFNPDSGIMWITTDIFSIKRIFARMVQMKNPDIKVINYFPPQVWERKRKLEHLLKIARQQNPDLRTQVRMGENDISLFSKMVGEPFYKWTLLDTYGDLNNPN